MKVKITLKTFGATAVFLVNYKSKRFYQLIHKSGKLNTDQYKALMTVVPRTVDDIDKFREHYEDRVDYELVLSQSKTLFKELMDIYFEWYQKETDITPKIDGVTGKHLKQIITFLKKQAADENEVKSIFEHILNSWEELDDFYKNQRELRQINTNINIILNTLKNGKQDSKTQARNVSNDFRKGI